MLPATDDMLMMAPPPRSIMPGSTARIVRTIDLHVEVEREVEIGVLHLQDRAGMDEAGAVEQHVDRADLGDRRVDRAVVEHVELARRDIGLPGELGQQPPR